MKNLNRFFDDYAVASMENNAEKVAAFYADSFIASSESQSHTFKNDEKFIDWLNEVFAFNQKAGLLDMKVKKTDISGLGKFSHRATVTWSVLFQSKPNDEIDFDIHYILINHENKYKILLYISDVDQETLMKQKGLL